MILYLNSNPVAGYSGFVLYDGNCAQQNSCIWMIPGTFFDDWDNR